ncbi:hypothetical protein [Lysinibacillus sp. TE18511]
MRNLVNHDKIKKNILLLLSFLLIVMSLSFNSIDAKAAMCEKDRKCLEAPTSNVTDKEFKNILKEVKTTADYKELAKTTAINQLNRLHRGYINNLWIVNRLLLKGASTASHRQFTDVLTN